MTFDAWETGIRPSNDCLMHWGIPGMKHGRRRYQNEDGTWTEAGLAARRKREGFGERRAAKKEARKAARAAAVEARKQRNIKNWSDADLQKKIARLKLEQEYRELNKNPLLKTGEELVSKYLAMKDAKIARQERVYKLENERMKNMAELDKAKAQRRQALNDTLDTIQFRSKGKMKAKAEFLKAKNERSKNTVRGALSSVTGNLIRKMGKRTVDDMSNESLLFRAGRGVKKGAKEGANKLVGLSKKTAEQMTERMTRESAEAKAKKTKRQKAKARKQGYDYKG